MCNRGDYQEEGGGCYLYRDSDQRWYAVQAGKGASSPTILGGDKRFRAARTDITDIRGAASPLEWQAYDTDAGDLRSETQHHDASFPF